MNQLSGAHELILTSPLRQFGAGTIGKRVSERRQYIPVEIISSLTNQYNDACEIAKQITLTNIQLFYPDREAFQKSSFLNDTYSFSVISEIEDKEHWLEILPHLSYIQAESWSHYAMSQVVHNDTKDSLLIVCCDVLPFVRDPRVILRAIRTLLLRDEKNRCFISIDTKHRCGSPYRMWSFTELQNVLEASGFLIDSAHDGEIFSFVVSCSVDSYQKFLNESGFSTQDFRLTERLLLTTEHPKAGKSGGIGSYFQEIEHLVGSNVVEICFVSQHHNPTPFALCNSKVLGFIINNDSYDKINDSDIALLLIEQALFYLPHIKIIEYQDYQGIGARIVQARNAGLLPANILLEVGCHGSILYVEAANQKWCGHEHNELITLEKISIEGADRVRFPTRFLQHFYQERGYRIDPEKIIYERYPFAVSSKINPEYKKLERIVFVGKQSPMKGFPEFLEVIYELVTKNQLEGLREIVCFGPVVEISLLDNHRKEFLKKKVRWREEFLERSAVQRELQNLSPDSIAFITYRGDNHPNVILEILNSGTPLLAFSTGGIPELIPESSHHLSLCTPTVQDAKKALLNMWSLSPEERKLLAHDSYEQFKKQQHEINSDIINRYAEKSSETLKKRVTTFTGNDYTFIVPTYNTKLSYIRELIESINVQSLFPKEVIWVDDASEEAYSKELEATIRDNIKIPYRMIRHGKNLGLSGARNTALHACTSEFVINIDSDDVITPEFLSIIRKTCNLNPEASAIVPYLEAFDDGDSWQCYDSNRYSYRPLGEGLIFGQLENRFGHANSSYRVRDIKAVGGWNQNSRAMWEDWELFERLVSNGRTIAVVPATTVLYRVQSKSMARTYARFPAMERIVLGQNMLPRFESFRLQAMMRDFLLLSEYQKLYEELKADYEAMSKQYNRLAHRIMRHIIAMFESMNLDFLYKKIKTFINKKNRTK